jgi:serine/threonine-protein kinase RsbW
VESVVKNTKVTQGAYVNPVNFVIESRLEEVPALGKEVRGFYASVCSDIHALYQIELCVNELLNNIIIHGHQNKSGHKIAISISLINKRAVIQITDSGIKFLPKLNYTEQTFDVLSALPHFGMGLFLIHKLMNEISFQEKDGKNQTHLIKDLHI